MSTKKLDLYQINNFYESLITTLNSLYYPYYLEFCYVPKLIFEPRRNVIYGNVIKIHWKFSKASLYSINLSYPFHKGWKCFGKSSWETEACRSSNWYEELHGTFRSDYWKFQGHQHGGWTASSFQGLLEPGCAKNYKCDTIN